MLVVHAGSRFEIPQPTPHATAPASSGVLESRAPAVHQPDSPAGGRSAPVYCAGMPGVRHLTAPLLSRILPYISHHNIGAILSIIRLLSKGMFFLRPQ